MLIKKSQILEPSWNAMWQCPIYDAMLLVPEHRYSCQPVCPLLLGHRRSYLLRHTWSRLIERSSDHRIAPRSH